MSAINLPQGSQEELKIKMHEMSNELWKLREENKILKGEKVIERYPLFFKHFLSVTKNCNHGKNDFDPSLRKFYTLLSFIGESFYQILVDLLGFPCFRSVQRYKHEVMAELHLDSQSFEPTPSKIIANIRRFIDPDDDDSRIILSIDALSLNTYVRVDNMGMIEGLTKTHSIEPEEALRIIMDNDGLEKFVKQHQSELISHAFVVYGNRMAPLKKSFPVVIIPSSKGNSDDLILSHLSQIQAVLTEEKVKVRGAAADGDPKYNILFKNQCKTMASLINYNFKMSLFENFHFDELPFFSDALHLLKNIRHRFVGGSKLWLFPGSCNKTISRDDFLSLGIPEYILTDSRAKNQEDLFPLIFFSMKYLSKSIRFHRPDLTYVLFPWVLLKNSIFVPSYTRSQRVEMLTSAFALILLYYISLQHYFKEKKSSPLIKKDQFFQKMNRKSKKEEKLGEQNAITLLDKGTCKKSLALIFNLIGELSKSETIHMGSLGSHFLEHFFGLIRRIDHGDDRFSNFLYSSIKTVLLNELKHEYGIEITIPSRISDSGVVISRDDPLEVKPFGNYLSFALNMINTMCQMESTSFPDVTVLKICRALYPANFTTEEFINVISHERVPIPIGISTTSKGMNKTGGLHNDARNETRSALLNIPPTHSKNEAISSEQTIFLDSVKIFKFDEKNISWSFKGDGIIMLNRDCTEKTTKIICKLNHIDLIFIQTTILPDFQFSMNMSNCFTFNQKNEFKSPDDNDVYNIKLSSDFKTEEFRQKIYQSIALQLSLI
jgi:hypothetical protein